ncbi:MAG: response regulator transcription factor [Blastocatellia bacterium]|jgi:two-component system, OmpR family, phosphate regulon response regulator PhoB
MTRLLLVEDDRSLGATLRERLAREGYDVLWVETQARATVELKSAWWDLVILDVGLPDGSGFELAREIKASSAIPIVFMTALGSAENRLEGFEIGAEEFIPKPFHLRELMIRVRHVLENHAIRPHIACNQRVIDLNARAIVQPDGQREYPPFKEFQMLQLLIVAAPRVVSRDEIIDALWGDESLPNQRTVDNLIVRLRHSLGDVGGQFIRSVRGVGYQWSAESQSEALAPGKMV